MLPGCAQPDFFDSFCTFCPSSVCHRSCVLAVASSGSVSVSATHRVVQALPEPPMPARVIWGNSFSALKKEPLYDFPLNLGFDNPALHPVCRFCI